MEVEGLLSQLIKIPSVNPPGGETKIAYFLKDLFDKAGIENEVIEPAPGRGNFLAYLGDGEKSLLFLSHTDVVPPGEGWDFDPFSGEIRDGFVYGRGALDCKGLVAAEAKAMLELSRLKLKGKLIFLASADEEAGGDYGVKYLLGNHLEKVSADFAINEGGEAPLKLGKEIIYFIQSGEKGVSWVKLKTKGKAAHGSLPSLGENAIVKMSQAILSLSQYKPEIKIIPEIQSLLNFLGEHFGMSPVNGENIDLLIEKIPDKSFAAWLRSITRLTMSANIIGGGIKTNIIPDYCEAQVDIRFHPGEDKNSLLQRLKGIIGHEVESEITDITMPSFSPIESPFFKVISQTIVGMVRGARVFPYISAGATDSRFLRQRGIPCYGPGICSPDHDPEIKSLYHAKNERIDIKSLQFKVQFLKNLAVNYLGVEGGEYGA